MTDLFSPHQSGALAELLVVDKSRITVAPACDLTAEQMAVLPVMGVPAAAAVVPIANELPKNARVRRHRAYCHT